VKRWACMEAECTTVVTAADDDELVEKVNAHMSEAHDSYELEDVILADAEDVAAGGG